ncbi:MAG: hypothetical protein ACRC8S_13155 [Fimbriiglobus sp.]
MAKSKGIPLDDFLDEDSKTSHASYPAEKRTAKGENQRRSKETNRRIKLDNDAVEIDNEERKAQSGRAAKDHRLLWRFRISLAVAALCYFCYWQIEVITLLYRQSDGRANLTTPVMVTLLSTTTANILGLLVIIYKFVFASPPESLAARNSKKQKSSK